MGQISGNLPLYYFYCNLLSVMCTWQINFSLSQEPQSRFGPQTAKFHRPPCFFGNSRTERRYFICKNPVAIQLQSTETICLHNTTMIKVKAHKAKSGRHYKTWSDSRDLSCVTYTACSYLWTVCLTWISIYRLQTSFDMSHLGRKVPVIHAWSVTGCIVLATAFDYWRPRYDIRYQKLSAIII